MKNFISLYDRNIFNMISYLLILLFLSNIPSSYFWQGKACGCTGYIINIRYKKKFLFLWYSYTIITNFINFIAHAKIVKGDETLRSGRRKAWTITVMNNFFYKNYLKKKITFYRILEYRKMKYNRYFIWWRHPTATMYFL